jgi:hypothetical protein
MWKGKQPRIHYFLHCINSKYREKERIGAIYQGFTCLAAKLLKVLLLKALKIIQRRRVCLMTTGNTNHSIINKTVHQTFPNC